ncbi:MULTISPECIES: type II secretion system protein [unclassified Shewanella]|uniref:type II secretion system protein n=1 Tax=unclassified Shewanella TaxID=196818 RepID=UPI001BB8486C|nr:MULTISPECIES: prepilin-type N-terminal cleavage/methylation domain-containing protein [unclassified Shewanella]GIU19105.1 PilD processed protein [Shewanella sp. MBTL60-112-B1]GIU40147.1 PilD processed protein [Shewanella sp. MBTL60-112-B2]
MKVLAKGFTLIELVVVIIVLGILAVIAAPKFINLSQDAHDATIKNTFASFTSGVKLFHSCWLTSGKTGYQVDLACYGDGTLDSSVTGYPLGKDTSQSDNGTKLLGEYCKEVWQGLLDNDDYTLVSHSGDPFVKGNDIVYWYQGGDISSPSGYCYYNYIADNPVRGSENWRLQYYPGSGKTEVVRSVLGQ